MRHSVDTASKNYLKLFDEETKSEQDVNIELEKEIVEMKDENIKLKQELQDVKAHSNDAYKPDDKLHIKRRADILYRYKQKNVQATDKTMTKYNLKYDNAKKLYE